MEIPVQYYASRQITISPDGRRVAWVAVSDRVGQIYARKLEETDFRPYRHGRRNQPRFLAAGAGLRPSKKDG
jgi:hypothetical protein